MKFDFNIIDLSLAALALLTWIFSPLRNKLFVSAFSAEYNRPLLKKVIDEMFEDELEEHDDMKETMAQLTSTLAENTKAVANLTRVIGLIEEKMDRVSQEVSYMKGVLDNSIDRRAKPRI